MPRKKPTRTKTPIDVDAFKTLIEAIESIYDIAFIAGHCNDCTQSKLSEMQESAFPPAGYLILLNESIAASLENDVGLVLHIRPGVVAPLSERKLKELKTDSQIEEELIEDACDRDTQRTEMLDNEEICGIVGCAFEGFGFSILLVEDDEDMYNLELHIEKEDWMENWKKVSEEDADYVVDDLIQRLNEGGEGIPPEALQRLYELHAEGKLPADIATAVEKLGSIVEVS